jgi:hypothetical protein
MFLGEGLSERDTACCRCIWLSTRWRTQRLDAWGGAGLNYGQWTEIVDAAGAAGAKEKECQRLTTSLLLIRLGMPTYYNPSTNYGPRFSVVPVSR